MTNAAKPGAILKSLRLQRGWKLSDVADKTGFPVSTVSKMENGKISLTYDKIARLSKGIGVDIGVFFAETTGDAPAVTLASGRRSVVRKGDGTVMETDNYRHQFVASDLLNKRFIPILAEVHVRSIADFGELVRHSGEEYTYVLEGTVDLYTDLYAPLRLEAGDSIYFDSGMGHAYIAVGDKPCRALTICSGEEPQLMAMHQQTAPSNKAAAPTEPAADPKPSAQPRKRRATGG